MIQLFSEIDPTDVQGNLILPFPADEIMPTPSKDAYCGLARELNPNFSDIKYNAYYASKLNNDVDNLMTFNPKHDPDFNIIGIGGRTSYHYPISTQYQRALQKLKRILDDPDKLANEFPQGMPFAINIALSHTDDPNIKAGYNTDNPITENEAINEARQLFGDSPFRVNLLKLKMAKDEDVKQALNPHGFQISPWA